MAFGTGTATISFPVSTRAAETVTNYEVKDTVPNPHIWTKVGEGWTFPESAKMAAGGGSIVIINSSTQVYVSTDGGATWGLYSLPHTATWMGICWTGTRFVAVDSAASWGHSLDGITWSEGGGSVPSVFSCGGIAYDSFHGRCITVSGDNTNTGSAYLPDGVNIWTAGGTIPAAALYSQFTACADNGWMIAAPVTANISGAITTDGGVTWGASTSAAGGQPTNKLAYNSAYLINFTGEIMYRASNYGGAWKTGWVAEGFNTKYGTNFTNGALASNGSTVIMIAPSTGYVISFTVPGTVADGGNRVISWIGEYGNFTSACWDPYRNRFVAISTTPNRGVFVSPTGGFTARQDNVRTSQANTITIKPAITNMGTNSITHTVTGLASLTADASIEVFMMASDSTSSHNTLEHELADISLTVENIVPGTGFDIVATSKQRLDGDFKVRYVWST